MTQSDVVNYLINTNDELKHTYLIYQDILYSFKKKDFNKLRKLLNNINPKISNYMKTSIKTLLEFLPYIKIHLRINIIMDLLKVIIIL